MVARRRRIKDITRSTVSDSVTVAIPRPIIDSTLSALSDSTSSRYVLPAQAIDSTLSTHIDRAVQSLASVADLTASAFSESTIASAIRVVDATLSMLADSAIALKVIAIDSTVSTRVRAYIYRILPPLPHQTEPCQSTSRLKT